MTSLREFLERHAFSGTAYSYETEEAGYAHTSARADCECGESFEVRNEDEDEAHRELLSEWSEHVVREGLGLIVELLSPRALEEIAS